MGVIDPARARSGRVGTLLRSIRRKERDKEIGGQSVTQHEHAAKQTNHRTGSKYFGMDEPESCIDLCAFELSQLHPSFSSSRFNTAMAPSLAAATGDALRVALSRTMHHAHSPTLANAIAGPSRLPLPATAAPAPAPVVRRFVISVRGAHQYTRGELKRILPTMSDLGLKSGDHGESQI